MILDWRFKTSDNYPNRLICDSGEIYNLKNGKKMKLKPSFGGYLRLRIYQDMGEVYKWVHRIIYELFVGDPTGLEIHHLDKDNQNNYYLNLQGLTPVEHKQYHKYKKR